MLIQPANNQQQNQNENLRVNTQFQIQKEVLRQALGTSPNSLQSQLLQLISSGLPNAQQAQATAQAQISKGYLDIKI
ncbi:MAG: hypothetical protein CH6_1323 [Candidatus Kapaibacterium sp.]|nr:MAG: hypothetical protein CH6_1323 [Candidatus Kapabacteria bacterium]